MSTVIAPEAPARMGEAVTAAAMLRYLEELGAWRHARRRELDELDARALASPDTDELAGDMTLSMALWQAVSVRHDELVRVWDGGRVGLVERERLSALVWGRLPAGAGPAGASLAVSLPEACRLSDALAGQLRLRLSLDPVGADLAAHLRSMRATLERVRDLVHAKPGAGGPGASPSGGGRTGTEPGGRADAERLLDRLERRLAVITERAGRGADVGGLVGSWESDAAVAERDLIVAAATRRDDERDRRRALELRARLVARAAHVGRLADSCVARVRPAPTLAVPRVEALGPVPDDAAAVDAYLVRLDQVSRALTRAEETYAAPLAEAGRLRALLDLYRAKAAGTGRDAHPEVGELYRLAHAVVDATPVDLPRARSAVAAYQALLLDGGPR